MKGPPKAKVKASKNGPGAPAKLGGGVAGGNMSGLAQALTAARPPRMARMAAPVKTRISKQGGVM